MTKEEAAIIIHKLKQDVLTGAVRKYEPFEGEVLLGAEFYDAINMAIEALEQEPCEDAISREAAVNACLNKWDKDYKEIVADIRALPPVTPAKKTGHWINTAEPYMSDNIVCSECGFNSIARYDYCPNCGAKMESEGKE